MELGLADRVAVVASDDAELGAACARVLTEEGATVVVAPLAKAVAEADEVLARHGRLDVVVLCEPRREPRSVEDVTEDELFLAWDDVVAAVDLYQRALPSMMKAGWGRFVAVTTSAVKWQRDTASDVDAMVGLGLLGLHKAAVADVARFGIVINAALRGDDDDVEAVASLVAFLSSQGAGYLQGVAIATDGAVSPAVF